MVQRVLGIVSFVCCALIIASFAFFAVDQMSGASQQQAAETAGTPIPAKSNPDRKQPRKFIDAASKALTSPFSSVVSSGSKWADHLILLVCGLTLYGVALGYLRRYTAGLPLRA